MDKNPKVGDVVWIPRYARNIYEGRITEFVNGNYVTYWHNHPTKPKGESVYKHPSHYKLSDFTSKSFLFESKKKPTIII